jgi:hypothetical protein
MSLSREQAQVTLRKMDLNHSILDLAPYHPKTSEITIETFDKQAVE